MSCDCNWQSESAHEWSQATKERTIEQQRAKKECVIALLDEGLPIPYGLQVECAYIIQKWHQEHKK